MDARPRAPAGPRGAIGAAAERAAAHHLRRAGWIILACNLRIGPDEIDILARDPSTGAAVVVEVRARSGPRFGSPAESVDARKVGRLYRAAQALRRGGHPALDRESIAGARWRVDLLTLERSSAGSWRVSGHLRGLQPP